MGNTDYGTLLSELPIFPLPGAVLFPGALLPLHVFEPRYVEMIGDVIAGDHFLAIANLDEDHEADELGRPAVYPIATIGSVVSSQELPDNRFGVLLHGRDRIRIERELPPEKLYRKVVATVLDDTEAVESSAPLIPQLVALCDQLSMHFDEGGDQLRELVRATDEPAALADSIASALVNESVDRQKFLENLDPSSRLSELVGHVSGLLVALKPRSEMPN
ncbi:MAG: LON peptidase substrate-binding domain-containing protein [Deltaproteobacteria bacterium]|nr:LON peptidase substrate-binding domain-containing protein [Deltaproteobacteria bacterium]